MPILRVSHQLISHNLSQMFIWTAAQDWILSITAALKSPEVALAVIDRESDFQPNNNECHCIAKMFELAVIICCVCLPLFDIML